MTRISRGIVGTPMVPALPWPPFGCLAIVSDYWLDPCVRPELRKARLNCRSHIPKPANSTYNFMAPSTRQESRDLMQNLKLILTESVVLGTTAVATMNSAEARLKPLARCGYDDYLVSEASAALVHHPLLTFILGRPLDSIFLLQIGSRSFDAMSTDTARFWRVRHRSRPQAQFLCATEQRPPSPTTTRGRGKTSRTNRTKPRISPSGSTESPRRTMTSC